MSLDEIKQSPQVEKKTGAKVDKEIAKRQRRAHMRSILKQKRAAGLVLTDEERAQLQLLKEYD